MLVGKESLIIEERDIPTSTEMGLDTSTCKSQSWPISLMRILMVLYSEIC